MAESTIGILAESENDCRVMETLVRRILDERRLSPRHYKLVHRAGNGASGLRGKCEQWMRDLARQGCRSVILMHDKDKHDEAALRARLRAFQVPEGVDRHVCIPVEELEAWFFSCDKALHVLCGDGARSHESPHCIRNPKEELIRLSLRVPGRLRYSPNDGEKAARVLDLDLCAKRCPAFRDVRVFVQQLASP